MSLNKIPENISRLDFNEFVNKSKNVSSDDSTLINNQSGLKNDEIFDCEFDWMEMKRPLIADLESLTTDYGRLEAEVIFKEFRNKNLERLIPALNVPGCGTRWQLFLEFASKNAQCDVCSWNYVEQQQQQQQQQQKKNDDKNVKSKAQSSSSNNCSTILNCCARSMFRAFGRSLGRVTSFRALAIDKEQVQTIFDKDCIFPTGELRTTETALVDIAKQHGVAKVCVARLFIAHLKRLVGHDCSVSLHDEWETTSIIAAGYMLAPHDKPVYLFEVSVPVIESCGWTLDAVKMRAETYLGSRYAVEDDEEDTERASWFAFSSPAADSPVWFDGSKQTTERYKFFGVPFLRSRLHHLYRFDTLDQLKQAVAPFVEQQERLLAQIPL